MSETPDSGGLLQWSGPLTPGTLTATMTASPRVSPGTVAPVVLTIPCPWSAASIRTRRAVHPAPPAGSSNSAERRVPGLAHRLASAPERVMLRTMITHEIWFEGAASPVLLDLEDDQLFLHFQQ